MDINGKNAVVVGGASGLGLATAEALRHRNAAVAILDNAESAGAQAAERLGGPFYPVDVTDFTGTEAALQRAVDDLGSLHITVTTAGGGATLGGLTLSDSGPHSLDAFRAVVDPQHRRHVQHQPVGRTAHEP